MRALAVRKKLEANRTHRGELERELSGARDEMQKLLRQARRLMPLKDAAVFAGIDYRHAKRLTASERR